MDLLYPLFSIAIVAGAVWYAATDGPRAKRREQEREKKYWDRWRRDHIAECLRQGIPIDEALALARATETYSQRKVATH